MNKKERVLLQDILIEDLIIKEAQRQETTINLIASENYVSPAVLKAAGSVLTNKYAEGYPGKRYYAGCEIVDQIEQIAIDRCKQLFNAEYVNVQPHAGSQANMGVYYALLQPGDTILGMNLNAGGHLTHGHAVNFSGKWFKSVQYGVSRDTELLDYDEIERLAHEHKPKLIIAGASAYSRVIDFERFAQIAHEVGAYLLADIAHIAGFVVTGLHPSPFPYADCVTSTTHKTLRGPRGGLIMAKQEHELRLNRSLMPGLQGGPSMHIIAAKAIAFYEALQPSFYEYQVQVIKNAQAMANTFSLLGYRIVAEKTDNHMFVLDLQSLVISGYANNITGYEAQLCLEEVGITVSRSSVPFDTQKPWITSGIRIGTPAITTRGLRESDAIEIVHLIDGVIKSRNCSNRDVVFAGVKCRIKAITGAFAL